MAYTSLALGRIYIARWSNQGQTLADYDRILAETGQICREAGPALAIGILPVDMPSPDGEVRRVMNQKMKDLLANCEVIHYVVEGSGFKSSTLRSVATSLVLLTGKRGRLFVHKTFEEALAALGPRLAELDILPTRVQLAAQRGGLLTPVRLSEARAL